MDENNNWLDEIQHTWLVDQETWDALQKILDRPPKECPKLQELFERQPPWDTDYK